MIIAQFYMELLLYVRVLLQHTVFNDTIARSFFWQNYRMFALLTQSIVSSDTIIAQNSLDRTVVYSCTINSYATLRY